MGHGELERGGKLALEQRADVERELAVRRHAKRDALATPRDLNEREVGGDLRRDANDAAQEHVRRFGRRIRGG